MKRVESSSVAGIQTPMATAFTLTISDEVPRLQPHVSSSVVSRNARVAQLLQEIARAIKQQKLDAVVSELIAKPRSRHL